MPIKEGYKTIIETSPNNLLLNRDGSLIYIKALMIKYSRVQTSPNLTTPF